MHLRSDLVAVFMHDFTLGDTTDTVAADKHHKQVFTRATLCVSAVFATATCPSVCPSVTPGIVSK